MQSFVASVTRYVVLNVKADIIHHLIELAQKKIRTLFRNVELDVEGHFFVRKKNLLAYFHFFSKFEHFVDYFFINIISLI